MRWIAVPSVMSALVLAAGCSSGPDDRNLRLPGEPVREGETALHAEPKRVADTEFKLLGLSTGIKEITGSHAQVNPRFGQFVRVRVIVTNHGRTNTSLNPSRQQLIVADGTAYPP